MINRTSSVQNPPAPREGVQDSKTNPSTPEKPPLSSIIARQDPYKPLPGMPIRSRDVDFKVITAENTNAPSTEPLEPVEKQDNSSNELPQFMQFRASDMDFEIEGAETSKPSVRQTDTQGDDKV